MDYWSRAEIAAEQLGVAIRRGLPPRGLWGVYEHRKRMITIRRTLGVMQRDWTIWHELGHAYYGHTGCNPKQERAATYWAVLHMFESEVVEQEMRAGLTATEISAALGVVPPVVDFLKAVWEERYMHRAAV